MVGVGDMMSGMVMGQIHLTATRGRLGGSTAHSETGSFLEIPSQTLPPKGQFQIQPIWQSRFTLTGSNAAPLFRRPGAKVREKRAEVEAWLTASIASYNRLLESRTDRRVRVWPSGCLHKTVPLPPC